jgi:hypothetical protein
MNFSEKLILAGLAISLLVLPACERRRPEDHHNGGLKGLCGQGVPCGQGPGAGKRYGQTDRIFEVYIYTDPDDSSKCWADIDVATLWTKTKKNGTPVNQRVTWFSDDGKEYFVDFTKGHYGSPFAESTFDVPKDGKKESGKVIQSGKYFDYAIYAGGAAVGTPCKDASDPGYRVNP